MGETYKFEQWHDRCVANAAETMFDEEKENVGHHSLFNQAIFPNATEFEPGQIYIGIRQCKPEYTNNEERDYQDFEEMVALFVESVDEERGQAVCFRVYYEISAFDKNSKQTIYWGRKEYPPYPERWVHHKITRIDGVQTIEYKSGLYDDYEVLEDSDDVPVLVSAKAKGELRGWWLEERKIDAEEPYDDSDMPF